MRHCGVIHSSESSVEFHILLQNVYRQEQQGKQTEIENQIVSSVDLEHFKTCWLSFCVLKAAVCSKCKG